MRTVVLPTSAPLIGMEFDPGGRFLAVVAVPSTVLLVPLGDGAPRTLEGPASQALYLGPAVSPGGSRVAATFCFGEGDRTLRLWDVETGRLQERPMPPVEDEPSPERALAGYAGGACRCAFVDESTLILSGRGGLRRWNLETGRVETLKVMDPPKGEVDLAVSRDLRTVLTMRPPPEGSGARPRRRGPRPGPGHLPKARDRSVAVSRPSPSTAEATSSPPGTWRGSSGWARWPEGSLVCSSGTREPSTGWPSRRTGAGWPPRATTTRCGSGPCLTDAAPAPHPPARGGSREAARAHQPPGRRRSRRPDGLEHRDRPLPGLGVPAGLAVTGHPGIFTESSSFR